MKTKITTMLTVLLASTAVTTFAATLDKSGAHQFAEEKYLALSNADGAAYEKGFRESFGPDWPYVVSGCAKFSKGSIFGIQAGGAALPKESSRASRITGEEDQDKAQAQLEAQLKAQIKDQAGYLFLQHGPLPPQYSKGSDSYEQAITSNLRQFWASRGVAFSSAANSFPASNAFSFAFMMCPPIR